MVMIAWAAALLAGTAPAQGICIKSGETTGASHAWYRNNDPITVGKRAFVKYGLPRQVPLAELEFLEDHDGVPVMIERGAAAYEVVYLLADADCTVQPYQLEPK